MDILIKYYYARVSSETQNLDRQVEYFKELGANPRTIFQEKKSGKSFEDREVWNELLNEWVKDGDVIVVKNLDRIGRNAKEVRECLVNLAARGVSVESVDQAYLNNFLKEKLVERDADSLAEAMLNVMLDTMLQVDLLKAEWERKELRKRQKEGIERALAKGVKFGRTKNDEFRQKFNEIYPLTRNKDNPKYVPVKDAIKMVGCSKAMFYNLIEEMKD
ncbi:MAG: recombinase family protein [Cetobacterium sp.]